MQLKNDTHVLVCDGGKYLLLQNTGDEDIISLQVVDHLETEHQSTKTLGADRPGSFSGGPVRRGGGEAVDVNDQIKERFVLEIIEQVHHLQQVGKLSHMVLVADQRSLGHLRDNMSVGLKATVIAEIAADHAHQTIAQIEQAITRF